MKFIVREPLLNAEHQILGYELCWHKNQHNDGMASEEELLELATFVAEQLRDDQAGWLLSDSVLFLEATPALISSGVVQSFPPQTTVFRLTAADLADPDTLETVARLRAEGYGISVCDAESLASDSSLLRLATHVEGKISESGMDIPLLQNQTVPVRVARHIKDWSEYERCVAERRFCFIGNVYLTSRSEKEKKGLNPAQLIIVQLMQMVRKNADIRELENVLKRDATLSYKLFRYINSAGFGLGAEIQSLRHAVTMLGYSRLYRWLSLLLATASTSSHSAAVLMQTAIVRGRFAELAATGILPKNEAENLFVVGMFSVLDRLLGISMEEVLEQIQLPELVSQALQSRAGMYGPFLALAEACEPDNGDVPAIAESLFINARHVNEAHLAALAWAQSIKI